MLGRRGLPLQWRAQLVWRPELLTCAMLAAGGRIVDGELGAIRCVDPLAIDVRLRAEQLRRCLISLGKRHDPWCDLS
jgi:hypothetical protein